MGGSQGRSRTSQVGSDRAGFPEAPLPTPLPPGSGISGVRAEGQPRPLLPSGLGIPPAKGGAAASASVQVGSHWTGNYSSSSHPPTHTQAPGLAPGPLLRPPRLARCVPGAGRKQTRRGGFAGSGVTLTQLRQSLMADTHSACSGGTVAVARKPAAA